MKFQLVAVISSLMAIAASTPVEAPNADVDDLHGNQKPSGDSFKHHADPRPTAGPVRASNTVVTTCTGENRSGTCTTHSISFSSGSTVTTCRKLQSPVYRNTGTFLVPSGMYCTIWANPESDGCSYPTTGDAIVYPPGSYDLHDLNGDDIGSNIVAFRCTECTNC